MIFKKYFEVFICDNEESIAIHHNIRYQVYCEELGYEDKEKFPDQQEIDEYDKFSTLFIVRYKITNEYIAAFRLIESIKTQLPLEKICVLHEPIKDNSIELSRVCVLDHIRTNKISDKENENIQNTILLGMIEAGSKYAFDKGINTAYWLIRPALSKLLKKLGLNMVKIGDLCEHKGIRYPYKATIRDIPQHYIKQFLTNDYYKYYSQSKKYTTFNPVTK